MGRDYRRERSGINAQAAQNIRRAALDYEAPKLLLVMISQLNGGYTTQGTSHQEEAGIIPVFHYPRVYLSTPSPTPTPAPLAPPDAYEPDDILAQAASVDVGGSLQIHTLSHMGDVDVVSFEAVEGFDYLIETLNLDPDVNTVIYLLNEDGDELAAGDDSAEDSSSRISWTAPQSGIYYVKIKQRGGSAYAPSRSPGQAAPVLISREADDDGRAIRVL